MEHRVTVYDEDEDLRTAWECDCGRGGSVSAMSDVGVASDRHIPEGDSRIDVYARD
jgi:hypothetical protein